MSLNQSDYDAMFKKYINVLDEFSMADIVVKLLTSIGIGTGD